jgi:hypothetical protein
VRIAEECLLFGPELAVEGRVFENNGDKKMPLFRRMSVSGRNQIYVRTLAREQSGSVAAGFEAKMAFI